MRGFVLRNLIIGFCVLTLTALFNPAVAIADTPRPGDPPPTDQAAHPASQAPNPSPKPTSSTSYKLDASKFSLTVSPTRLSIRPDEIGDTQQISVINRGRAPLKVQVQKRNFKTNRDGGLSYQRDAPYAAAEWLTVAPVSFEVLPGATQMVTATVEPPTSPEPGDHQVALVFLVPAGRTDDNVKINRGIATPLFITVPGKVDDSVRLLELAAPPFAAGGSVTVQAQVQNIGTVHRDFRGSERLALDVAGSATPFPDFTVPRGSTRDVSTNWNPPVLCVCHPTLKIVNANGDEQTATVRVIVFPWPWVVGGLVLLLLGFVAFRVYRRRHSGIQAPAASKPSRSM